MITDLRKVPKKEIEFTLEPTMWLDREGYLRLHGKGTISYNGEPIAKIKFKDSIYDYPSVKASLVEMFTKEYKGIRTIIQEFNDKNNVEFLGREIAGLVNRSDLLFRTTLEEAYIG